METVTIGLIIVGGFFSFLMWLIFRGLIKDGAITTSTPFVFLLGNDYKTE